jgi:hypothetical protein
MDPNRDFIIHKKNSTFLLTIELKFYCLLVILVLILENKYHVATDRIFVFNLLINNKIGQCVI